MLFLPHRPTLTIIEQRNKLIITTSNQILFASLDFLEQYITTHLVSAHPISLAYSSQKSEALVITKNCVMIYWTDWQHRVELHLALYLNNERIYSFDWGQKCVVYGEFRQYSTKKLTLYNIRNYDQDLPSCFLGQTQFLITNKRIVIYDHKIGKRKNVQWQDSRQWLPKLIEGKMQLSAFRTYQGNTLLRIQNLCLIIKQSKVMNQMSNDGILIINKCMAVWFFNNRMKIYQVDEYQFIDLGQIQAYQGHYYTSTVYDDKLLLFFYDFKELQMKTLKLVSADEIQEEERKRQEKELLKRSMREEPAITEKAVSQSSKPLVKVKSQYLASDSKSVRFKGGSMQQALKASINSFKKEVEKSIKNQNYQDSPLDQKYLKINNDKLIKFPELKKRVDFDSPNRLSPEPRPEKPIQLTKSVRGKKELSEYEQQQQSPDLVNQLKSSILSSLSSFQVEPALKHASSAVDTRTGDSCGVFHNQSTCNQRKQSGDFPKNDKQNGKSLIRKMSKIYRQQPQKFEQALEYAVEHIIQQNDARLFFAQHVRLFNSDLTKDRLLRLYRHILDSPTNKKLMATALSQFKLSQVPQVCLPIGHEILHVFFIIYPSVYIEDLLHPTINVYQDLIQSYFNRRIMDQIIKIQEESIELAHPRNLLNILLYLNEYFQLQLDLLFEVYAKSMMKHQCSHILKRIMESNIFNICQVDRGVFEKAAVSVLRQILEQYPDNFERAKPIIDLMEKDTREMFQQIINMMDDFNSCSLTFIISPVFDLSQTKSSLNFMSDLINNNSADNLVNMNISSLFKYMSKIESGQYISYYTNNHIKIMKQLSQKLMKNGYYGPALQILSPVSHLIKRGFIAALLFKYLEGKYANRLVGMKVIEPAKFQIIFRQLLIENRNQIERDPIPVLIQTNIKLIDWTEFKNLCASYLPEFSWEFSYILYSDILLSNELVAEQILTSEQLYFLQKKIGYSTQEIRRLTLIEAKDENLHLPLFTRQVLYKDNQTTDNPFFLNVKSNQNSLTAQRSLKAFNRTEQFLCNNRRCSVLKNGEQPDSALVSLRLQVYQNKILAMLQEYYKQSPKDKFLRAINVVDKQRVKLCNIDNYKSLVQANIDYPFYNLIPFCYFINQTKAWEITQKYIKTELTIDNFWILYLIINILYKRGGSVANMLIERIISEEEDIWSEAIQLILENINLDNSFLIKMASIAQKRQLISIKSVINTFVKNDC